MITPIAIFTTIINTTTGKWESVMVLPEFAHFYDEDRFIVFFYNVDRYVTIPGWEFADVRDEWLAQFEVA